MEPTPTIAFLYTLDANVKLFHPYIEQYLGNDRHQLIHHVDESLLKRAMQEGLTDAVTHAVHAAIHRLAEQGADIIICTCSTIGEMAENTPNLTASVIRVDRPMANAAILHPHITVLAAVESTITPTTDLITACAKSANQQPSITTGVIPEAWSYYASGDTIGYANTIADYIRQCGGASRQTAANTMTKPTEVIVLAQASMSHAMHYLDADIAANVFTSPELCLKHIAALANTHFTR